MCYFVPLARFEHILNTSLFPKLSIVCSVSMTDGCTLTVFSSPFYQCIILALCNKQPVLNHFMLLSFIVYRASFSSLRPV